MQILFNKQIFIDNNYKPQFKGCKETFIRTYSKYYMKPLAETVDNIVKNNANYLGEGYFKRGFKFPFLNNYVIRLYKHSQQKSTKITGPVDILDKLNGVCLKYGDIFDIVKKKTGVSLGVNNYGQILKENLKPEREQTLKLLEMYKKIAEFPISSYVNLAKQMIKINNSRICQFDFINPSNILIDLDKKKISAIDPISQFENEYIYKIEDARSVSGCDSLYFAICDTCLHEKHVSNLNKGEIDDWDNAIETIIRKSIIAGKKLQLPRNIEKLKFMHKSQDEFHKFNVFIPKINYFLNRYDSAIYEDKYLQCAVNPVNSEYERYEAIKKIKNNDFKVVKPIFEEILLAPRALKTECPEIIDITLDKIAYYGKEARTIVPVLEKMLNAEVFPSTQKKLYGLFIKLEPNNSYFINKIKEESLNSIGSTFFSEEIVNLYQIRNNLTSKNKIAVENLYKQYLTQEKIDQSILNKLWLSRTCVASKLEQQQVVKNMIKAYEYVNTKNIGYKPLISDLEKIHKILFNELPYADDIAGKFRRSGKNPYKELFFKKHVITDKTIVKYPRSSLVAEEMKKIQEYIDQNYGKMDPFLFVTTIHRKIINIHPFYDGNGRSTRLFMELILRGNGYKLTKYPEELLYNRVYTPEEQAKCLKLYSEKL